MKKKALLKLADYLEKTDFSKTEKELPRRRKLKISDADVRWIKRMYPKHISMHYAAKMFKVSVPYISDIINGKRRASIGSNWEERPKTVARRIRKFVEGK